MTLRLPDAAALDALLKRSHVRVAGEKRAEKQVDGPQKPPKRGMNGTESAWAEVLEERKRAGAVFWYRFEPMRLRLADGTYYKPDFAVLTARGLEYHEIKGFMREAARVRLAVAAELFPFRFFLIRRDRGGWDTTEIPGLAQVGTAGA